MGCWGTAEPAPDLLWTWGVRIRPDDRPHSGDACSRSAERRNAAAALLLVCAVWSLLWLVSWTQQRLLTASGDPLFPFIAATALLLVRRAARPGPRHRAAAAQRALAALLGLVAGWSAYPGLLVAIAVVGLWLRLPAIGVGASLRPDAAHLISIVLLAPIFEELLYRERLLEGLAPVTGGPLAIAISSAVFAASHVAAWSVLGTFLVGLLLGCLQRFGRDVLICIALHGGLNLASLLCAPAASHLCPPPLPGVGIGLLCLGLALAAILSDGRNRALSSWEARPPPASSPSSGGEARRARAGPPPL